QIKERVPKVIPHKTLYISDYIFSCYAFLFIFDFPNPLSKHILQFHASFFSPKKRDFSPRCQEKTMTPFVHPIRRKTPENPGLTGRSKSFTL
ncbi:hypothetical protein, partial [Alistipes putredinis]|uniref:hypothetical protein n=1 Tax=Alistipes putredinis TaxID=28117 RepID=UPI003A8A79D6